MLEASYDFHLSVYDESVTIYVRLCGTDGNCPLLEAAHWVKDEWVEDDTLTPSIANAVSLAFTSPHFLMKLSYEHVRSQMLIEELGSEWVAWLDDCFGGE